MEGIGIREVNTLVIQLIVAYLQTSQGLPHDRFVQDVGCDALHYLTVFLLGQSSLHTREVVDVEDGS